LAKEETLKLNGRTRWVWPDQPSLSLPTITRDLKPGSRPAISPTLVTQQAVIPHPSAGSTIPKQLMIHPKAASIVPKHSILHPSKSAGVQARHRRLLQALQSPEGLVKGVLSRVVRAYLHSETRLSKEQDAMDTA